MLIVSDVQADSVQRLELVKKKLQARKLTDFPGENVEAYAKDIMHKCKELHHGRMLPNNVCLTIIDHLSTCSVEAFRIEFLSMRPAVVNQLRQSAGKTQQKIDKRQLTATGTHTSLCWKLLASHTGV